jgi:RNA polymerase sigma-70 factor (ECF subfamily)
MERTGSPEADPPGALAPEGAIPGGTASRSTGAVESTTTGAEADPEHDLIRRAQKGDERAFETLVARHQQRAFRIARHLVPNPEDARDLVQDAFVRIFRNLDRFDFQFSFTTWLHRIVTNLAIDHLRKRRLVAGPGRGDDDEGPEPEFADPAAAAPSERLEASETAREVRECIGALAPHFQAVLTLRELEGLACTEIAKIVGATHVTVRWRLHRGRKLFQEEWERRQRLKAAEALGLPRPQTPPGPDT